MRRNRPSRTAGYVAQVRALLDRESVIDDPFAIVMLAPAGRALVGLLSRWPFTLLLGSPFFASLAARIIFFDDQVADAIDSEIDQVVVVGAGYDSRAWRFARPGVTFYEVDHPATQAEKQRRAPGSGPVYIHADLRTESVIDAVVAAGFNPHRPAIVVIEGVTMYLEERDVRALLAGLAQRTTAGTRLVVNFAAPKGAGTVLDRARQSALRLLGASRGEPHRFFLHADQIAAFLHTAGWSRSEVVTLRDVAQRTLVGTRLNPDRLHTAAGAAVATR